LSSAARQTVPAGSPLRRPTSTRDATLSRLLLEDDIRTLPLSS
jgi:hypothetical protein